MAKKKRVNILFGSNVPKLIETVTREMEAELQAQKGNDTRTYCDIEEVSSEKAI